jgi:hypothetical protein
MQATIEKLRNRSKEDRQVIATVSSGAIVAVLLLGWGISSMGAFSNISENQTAAVAASDRSVLGQVMKQPDSVGTEVPVQSQTITTDNGVTQKGTVVTIPATSN